MARALYNGKILFSALSDANALSGRRIFSSAASISEKGMLGEKAALNTGMKKSGSATSDEAAGPMPWVPDPVTGYYRPANRLREIDPAEQRQMFLNNKE